MQLFDFVKYEKCTACITEDGRQYTYGELERMCREFGQYVSGRSLLFIVCSNKMGTLIGYLSAMKNGHVPLLLGKDMALTDMRKLCEEYTPSYLWMPEEMADMWDADVVWKNWDYVLVRSRYQAPVLHKDLALLLPTSESTGNSKMVRLSHGNLLANTKSICQYLGITKDERAITTLPMNYTYGLSVIHTHLHKGATLLLTERSVLDKSFWDFFRKWESSSMSGVPYTYEMLRLGGFSSMQLPSLKTMTQAGGKLKERERRYFSEYATQKGIHLYIMYGQTEATARMSYLSPELVGTRGASIGKAIPGGRLSIQDETGKELKPYEQGELVYEGANVMLGYATGKKDLVLGDVMHGKLRTGDLGYQDEEGLCYIEGRKTRFVKICGRRMNLDDIEEYLSVGLGREIRCMEVMEQVGIVYEGETADGAFVEMIRNTLYDKYRIPKNQMVVHCVWEIPHLVSGKVDYGILQMKLYELIYE